MNNRFFGYLSVVVGVFACFAGGCFMLLGGQVGFAGFIIGVFLIVSGALMARDR